jgi:pimeloyl-ACP methyl ester carboxylesterase
MSFTPPSLSRITTKTLILYGDRDPLYPVEMALEMVRSIPRSALWIVPDAGHGPVYGGAADDFVRVSLSFLRNGAAGEAVLSSTSG